MQRKKKNLQGLELPIIATPSHKNEHNCDANAGRQRGAGLGLHRSGCEGLWVGGDSLFLTFLLRTWGAGRFGLDGQSSHCFPNGPSSYRG